MFQLLYDFHETRKKGLIGDTACAEMLSDIKYLRRVVRDLNEVASEQVLELQPLKKA